MNPELNTRVLVVDDEPIVRDSIREILCPQRRDYGALDAASMQLFDEPAPVAPSRWSLEVLQIELDEASSGRSALEMVQRAMDQRRPYALILLDMRMPGWDGLTTAQALREVDQKAEIVFVTAHSDHAIRDVVQRAGPHVGYLCKPFVAEEIQQMATKAIYDWSRLRNLESLIGVLSTLRVSDGQLDTLRRSIFDQATSWLGARSAMFVCQEDGGEPYVLVRIGSLGRDDVARSCLEAVTPLLGTGEIRRIGDLTYFPFDHCALIVHDEDGTPLSTERLYLFRLFLEHSNQALQNARLHGALISQEKLSAVGQALSIVVHDLRSPIGMIVSSTELAREEPGTPSGVIELLDIIVQATDNAMAIVNDVLDFTRTSRLDKASCRVDELLEQVRAHLRSRPGYDDSGVRLELDGVMGQTLVCDSRKLQRALLNLVSNAAEALIASRTPDPVVHVDVSGDHDAVVFRVRDNGPGIPEPMRARLFEPFATFGKAGGTGLGLAIVQQIVEAHDGRIRVDTSPRGTTFTVTLPRA